MPFTVSHAVAVIPLYKYLGKFGALSALILGSMMPDFVYMTPHIDRYVDSHSLLGIYLFTIPMGLTIYFIYHLLMAPVIVSLLPQFIQKHLHNDLFLGKIPNIPSYTLVLSLVIGALTHITWDFFTHQSGIPQYISWMDVPLTAIDSYDIMPYRVLQHFSTLFGLSLLIFWIWKWISGKKLTTSSQKQAQHWQAPKKLKLFSLFVIIIIPMIFGALNGMAHTTGSTVMYGLYDIQIFIRFGIVGAAKAFIISCALLGLIYQFILYKTNISEKT